MATAKVHGLIINYEVIGDKGPPVALMTGGRRGYKELVSLGRKIAANGYRVFFHDRRNTGASDTLIDGDEVEEVVWADDLHELPIVDQDVPLVPFGEWAFHEEEITRVFVDFMRRVDTHHP